MRRLVPQGPRLDLATVESFMDDYQGDVAETVKGHSPPKLASELSENTEPS